MIDQFFEQPILNSPYEYPRRHWELDQSGQPTSNILDKRRPAEFITPIPKPKKQKGQKDQQEMVFDEGTGLSTAEQQYDTMAMVNEVRRRVDLWRGFSSPNEWQVTPETARLLQHWRHHEFSNLRPFFCQLEAVETAIWLSEVAPKQGKGVRALLDGLSSASEEANPGLARIALKLATGAGKTTVMAMIIAWQTINAVRRPNSKKFTRGFLVVSPGITIKDRLRVLQPHDPDSYYQSRELVPGDMLADLDRAKIVITNYHAFKLRETMDLSKGGRSLLQGRGDELQTLETEGQMLQRVMPDLMGMKNVLILNDEAHHCYREKPINAVLDAYNPTGSTMHVNFNTSKQDRWETDARRCHINWVILDSDWEAEFCRVAEAHPRVKAYVKNHNLGFEVPYKYGSESRRYRPDFIVLVDDGHGDEDLLHLVVEIKGYRREDAKVKKSTMEIYWVPGVNNLKTFGRWAFAEFCDVYAMESDFEAKVEVEFGKMIESATSDSSTMEGNA